MLNEKDFENHVLSQLISNGWKYIEAKNLPRTTSSVFIEPMIRDALIRLNPEIASCPDNAELVIYKLRALTLSVQSHDLITYNERFKKMIFDENSYPIGENGRMVTVKFFDFSEHAPVNEYIVTNQYNFNGKELDIVLFINGFPLVVGELKTPTRSSVTWYDGAKDILDYEKSLPQLFVCNVLNFATEGKFYRYGSIGLPLEKWGPWHTINNKNEGTLECVNRSMADMLLPEKILDIFRFFTLFATDNKHRKIKIVCRYQQYEGANLLIDRVL